MKSKRIQQMFRKTGFFSVGLIAGIPFQVQAQSAPMNVIFILADDLGWSDVTLYGTTALYETPNIERLAARGMTFTRAYSASPLSSPTRASILTGQTPARNGITAPNCHLPQARMHPTVLSRAPSSDKAIGCESATRLDTNLPTLGKIMKGSGYATAHFGKWHLGPEPYSAADHGFETDIPHWPGPGPAGSYVAPWKYPDFAPKEPQEHIEDRMAREALEWLRNRPSDRPFYMNYWQFSVHAPFNAKKELVEKYRNKIDTTNVQRSSTYAAMVESMDDAVGKLLDEVDRQGIADNTVIVFISDNGGNCYSTLQETLPDGTDYIAVPTSNAPLRGGKATMFEGGIRVPCIIVWPGVTRPGSRCDEIVQTTDFYPTFLEMLDLTPQQGHVIDGRSLLPSLRGEKRGRRPVFTYFPHNPPVPEWMPPSVSVHYGDWKLIRQFYQGEHGEHGYLLYNLKHDVGERLNLASKHKGLVRKMDAMIERHLSDAATVIPQPNPRFDPKQYRPENIGVSKPRKPIIP